MSLGKDVDVCLIPDMRMIHGFPPSLPPLGFIHAHILLRQRGHDNAATGFMASCK